MRKYIDIHSHIIFGADDGAETPDEAIELLKLDRDEGAYAVFATPHYGHENVGEPDASEVLKKFELLRERAAEEVPEITLYMGTEWYCAWDLADRIRQGEAFRMNGTDYTTTVYECTDCDGCPLKEKCIRACGSKKPLEERHKVLNVSKRFARQREEMEKKITSKEGILLRVNRSIQAEGTFAFAKEDMDFRRFLTRGKKVAVEWLLLSMAINILKLHFKIPKGRMGTALKVPESFPVGL